MGSEYAGSGASFPKINNNNLLFEKFAVNQSGNPNYFGSNYRNYIDIDAQNNSWDRLIEIEIGIRI